MLKPVMLLSSQAMDWTQPPSGGCVLKLVPVVLMHQNRRAAAFGRLCVETICQSIKYVDLQAAAFGRLCVETCRAKKTRPES